MTGAELRRAERKLARESSEYGSCSMSYDDMRTGLTFADVRAMMYVANKDPRTWRNRNRHGVLGFWRGLKLQQWDEHTAQCARIRDRIRADLTGVPF